MEKEIRQLETALNELHKSNDVTRAAYSTLKFAVEQVKNCSIPVVVGQSEQFTCKHCGTNEKQWSRKNDDWYCKTCGYICR